MKKLLCMVLFILFAVMMLSAPALAEAAAAQAETGVDITGIVLAVIEFTIAFLAYKVWPWVKTKTSEVQQNALLTAAEVAVYAAEKVFGNGNGEKKLARVKSRLKAKGYDVDSAEVIDAIEAAVESLPMKISASAFSTETADEDEEEADEPEDVEDEDPQK